ncbi:MAG: AAA family ATPase [Propionibacterium sp.]
MNGDYDEIIDDVLNGSPTAGQTREDDESQRDDSARIFEFDVAKMVHRLEVQREAQRRIALNGRDTADWDVASLGQVLARQAPPPARVDELIPSDAGTLIVAQRKVGKTTWLLNLARALIVGGTFLGRFDVQPVKGRVAYLNFEVSGWTLARWADEVGVPRDRLILVNLRGARNPLSDPQDRAALAEVLRALDCEVVIVDPFGRAFDGTNQNDTSEVAPWLNRLDRWARGEVGARDVILAAHAGWNGERSRGSSALEDWADSIINFTKDADDQRYMRAIGRDVDLEEDRLEFDPGTRLLTLTGDGSRSGAARTRQSQELTTAVLRTVAEHPGVNGTEMEELLRSSGAHFQKSDGRRAANQLAEQGRLVREQGPRNSSLYYPIRPSATDEFSSPEAGLTSPGVVDENMPKSGKTPSQTLPDLTRTPTRDEPKSSPEAPGQLKPLVNTGKRAPHPTSPDLTPGKPDDLTQKPLKGFGSGQVNFGSPSAPDEQGSTCTVCGERMTVVEPGQTTHPGCEPTPPPVLPEPDPDPPADAVDVFMAELNAYSGGAA